MEEFKKFLSLKRTEITEITDGLVSALKDLVMQKNNKILLLNNKINELEEKNKKQNKTIDSNLFRKILKLNNPDLLKVRINNKLFKKILKKELKIKNLRKIIEKLRDKNSKTSVINTKEMTAFKLIAVELDEKEKIIKNNNVTIDNLKNEKNSLNKNIDIYLDEIEELKNKINTLNNENRKLTTSNDSQLQTIGALTDELQNKNKKIMDLKDSFIEILDNYNNILEQVN
jgi:chromosome segregation ATPase